MIGSGVGRHEEGRAMARKFPISMGGGGHSTSKGSLHVCYSYCTQLKELFFCEQAHKLAVWLKMVTFVTSDLLFMPTEDFVRHADYALKSTERDLPMYCHFSVI